MFLSFKILISADDCWAELKRDSKVQHFWENIASRLLLFTFLTEFFFAAFVILLSCLVVYIVQRTY